MKPQAHGESGESEAKVTQLCPTLWDPMDYTVHGVLQARASGWTAFPFSRGSSQPRDRIQASGTAGDSLPAEPPGKANWKNGSRTHRALEERRRAHFLKR